MTPRQWASVSGSGLFCLRNATISVSKQTADRGVKRSASTSPTLVNNDVDLGRVSHSRPALVAPYTCPEFDSNTFSRHDYLPDTSPNVLDYHISWPRAPQDALRPGALRSSSLKTKTRSLTRQDMPKMTRRTSLPQSPRAPRGERRDPDASPLLPPLQPRRHHRGVGDQRRAWRQTQHSLQRRR